MNYRTEQFCFFFVVCHTIEQYEELCYVLIMSEILTILFKFRFCLNRNVVIKISRFSSLFLRFISLWIAAANCEWPSFVASLFRRLSRLFSFTKWIISGVKRHFWKCFFVTGHALWNASFIADVMNETSLSTSSGVDGLRIGKSRKLSLKCLNAYLPSFSLFLPHPTLKFPAPYFFIHHLQHSLLCNKITIPYKSV